MKRLFLALLGILLLGTATVGAEERAPTSTKTVHMKIEGMTCGMCVKKVEAQLVPLCKKGLSVDFKKGESICHYEPSVTEAQILSEANKTGFKTSKLN